MTTRPTIRDVAREAGVAVVTVSPERQGEEAIEMLLARLAGDTSTTSRYVEATPHLRASTSC